MTIHSKTNGQVFEIRLAREEVLNALDLEHLQQLEAAFDEAADNDELRVVLLSATGRAFCVGGDIKAMDRMSDAEFERCTRHYQDLCRKTQALQIPVIAALNGYVLGGGLEIALMADLRIAATSARLGLPDAELGFSPSGGLSKRLNQVVGAGWSMHLALCGDIIDARQALAIGLVTRVVEDADLSSVSLSLAQQLAAYPPTGMRNIKRVLTAALESDLETTLHLEEQLDNECYHSSETRAALRDFLQSRKK